MKARAVSKQRKEKDTDSSSHLIESYAEVDSDELALDRIHEDVRDVTISESDDMADDGRRCDTARVVEAHVEPQGRRLVLLVEEVSHHGRHAREDLLERGVLEGEGLGVIGRLDNISHPLASLARSKVGRRQAPAESRQPSSA